MNYLNLFLTGLAAMACLSCSGSDDTTTPSPTTNTLTVAPTKIEATAQAANYTVAVEASRGEWSSYSEANWITLANTNTNQSKGTITVSVAQNQGTATREGTVTVKSGTARATLTITQAAPKLPDVDPSITVPEGYRLVWHDEFDGTILGSDWVQEVKPAGWVNNELQTYISGPTVNEVAGGTLNIHCYKGSDGKVYSGRVYAKPSQGWLYGYFEARIMLPKGKGTWPAFWMMPSNNDFSKNPWPLCGEIDIMEEVGTVPNEVSSSLHTQDYNHTKGTQKTHAMTLADAEGAYHVYAVEWTPEAITTYVDGKVQLAVTKAQMGSNQEQWPFHYAFYPILNLAWGGSWGGMNGVDESALPVTMKVDYVRIFQK